MPKKDDDIYKNYLPTSEDLNDYTPVRHGEDSLNLTDSQEISLGNINLPVVFQEITRIKSDPSLMKTYIATFRAKYKLKKEIEIVNKLEEYCKAVGGGVASQTELTRMQTSLLDAQREQILSAHRLRNINASLKIQTLEDEVKIAELEKRLQEVRKGTNTADDLVTRRQEIEHQQHIKDLKDYEDFLKATSELGKKAKLMRMLEEKIQRLEEEIKANLLLTDKQKEKQIKDLRDLYYNMLNRYGR